MDERDAITCGFDRLQKQSKLDKRRQRAHRLRALQAARKRGWVAGVTEAADLARAYNRCTVHKYDLGDCILAKLNQLPKSAVRRHTRQTRGVGTRAY